MAAHLILAAGLRTSPMEHTCRISTQEKTDLADVRYVGGLRYSTLTTRTVAVALPVNGTAPAPKRRRGAPGHILFSRCLPGAGGEARPLKRRCRWPH